MRISWPSSRSWSRARSSSAAKRAPSRSSEASRVAGGERQGILVRVREPLTIGGEALVAEPLGKVAAVDAEGLLRFRRPAADEPLEAMGVDLEVDRRPQPDRVLVGLDDTVGIDAGAVQRAAEQPQRLAERGGAAGVGIGPEVGGDGFPRAQPRPQGEQGEEGLGVAPGHPQLMAVDDGADPAEQADRDGDRFERSCLVSWVHGRLLGCGRSWAAGRLRPSPRRAGWRHSDDPSDRGTPKRLDPHGSHGSRGATPTWPPARGRAVRSPDDGSASRAVVSGGRTRSLSASRHPARLICTRLVMATLTCTVPFATIVFEFDPLLRIGDSTVRYETLGLAGAALVGILLAAMLAGRTAITASSRRGARPGPAPGRRPPPAGRPAVHRPRDRAGSGDRRTDRLRPPPPRLLHGERVGDPRPVAGQPRARTGGPRRACSPGRTWPACSMRRSDAGSTSRPCRSSSPSPSARAPGSSAGAARAPRATPPGRPPTSARGRGARSARRSRPIRPRRTARSRPRWRSSGSASSSGSAASAAPRGSAFFVALLMWAIGRVAVTTTWRDEPVLGPDPGRRHHRDRCRRRGGRRTVARPLERGAGPIPGPRGADHRRVGRPGRSRRTGPGSDVAGGPRS